MLIIKYDSEKGKVLPDGCIRAWADDVVKRYKSKVPNTTMRVTVGSVIMVDTLRVLIAKKELDYKEVVYRFKDLTLNVSKDGGMPMWPPGFCDIYDDILEELLTWKKPTEKEANKNA